MSIKTNGWLGRIWRSKSPYASGFFLICKKDGKYCPVQDYCCLNKWTIPNKYPLPLITDLIHNLAGKKLFLRFNIWWGYNNVCIKEGDEWKGTFKGLFEPMVMFFELTNSHVTFQTMMDDIFQEEITQEWLKIYMDNMIIATENDNALHTQKVNQILQKLIDHNLFLKPEKCQFHKKEVKYLGVIIGGGKVMMDPIKVKGITKWPTPTTVKEVCSFLGFCNFYCPFILNFSGIAWPLNDLTKKNQQWQWEDREKEAFDTLKEICASKLVLWSPDWSRKFILETDASGYALGAVISQEYEDGIHPVAFHSCSLQPAEKNYDAHDKELAAVIFGFKCGWPLFLGAQHTMEVKSNHKNLQYFREPQKVTGWQARWIQFLQDFDYTLTHIPGHTNTIADLLSWRKDLNKGVNTEEPHILLPDTLFSKKLFLEDNLEKQQQILWELHNGPTGGHPGIANTWNIVKQSYEGPRLQQFVEEYIKGCAKCQESKINLPKKKAPLQPFNTAINQGPFQYMSMDLITDLPISDRYDSILTIVDQGCSKAAKYIPCYKMINGQGVANEYLKHLIPWFRLPKHIISNRDPQFVSHFSMTLCKNLRIQQNLSITFHPWTNGQTERMNAWIKQYLHPWMSSQPHNWAKILPIAKYAHNS
jgi:RNase H-like domain found in reverse transcriptase/Integrase zinc binding domain/Reverse transcriptase (RNA-dependent DNA polymerase)